MKLKKNEQLKYNIYLAIKEYSKEHCMYPTSKELYTTLVSLPYDTKNTPKRVKRHDLFNKYIDAIVIWYTIDFIKQVECPQSLHQYIDGMFIEYFYNVIESPRSLLGFVGDGHTKLSIPFRLLYQHWMHVHEDLYILNKKLSVEILARKMGVEFVEDEELNTDTLVLLPLVEKSLYPDSYLTCKEFSNSKRLGVKVFPYLEEVFKLEGIEYMLKSN